MYEKVTETPIKGGIVLAKSNFGGLKFVKIKPREIYTILIRKMTCIRHLELDSI